MVVLAFVRVWMIINAIVRQVLVVWNVKPHCLVNRKIVVVFLLKNGLIFIECADANIKCPNGDCVDTGHADLPVYCQCFDGTRRDPRNNDTCPQSPLFPRKNLCFTNISLLFRSVLRTKYWKSYLPKWWYMSNS